MTDPRYAKGKIAVASLPPTIRVCGHDITIERWGSTAANACHRWGEFSSVEQMIRIREDMPTPQQAANTLLHEVNHAVFWLYGVGKDDDEERIVTTLANAWTAVYRDNPWLPFWLSECIR